MQRIARNTIASYVGTISTFLVGLILVPYIIHELGDTQYGVWSIILSTFAFFAVVDFGLANALAKYTAEYSTLDKSTTVEEMTSTLFYLFMGVGVIIFIGILLLSFRFNQFFNVPPEYAHDSQIAVLIFGFNIAITLPLSVYNALTVGNQRFVLLNSGIVIKQAIILMLTIVALNLGWGLISLASIQLIVTIFSALWLRWSLAKWGNISVGLKISYFKRQHLTILLGYSVYMFIMMLVRRMESSAGPIIIGHSVSLDDVTLYTIGVKVGSVVRQLVFPMSLALFPAFSALHALNDVQRKSKLLIESLRASLLVGLPVAGFFIVLVHPLISVWIGAEYTTSTMVAIIFIIQALVLQLMMTSSSILIGVGDLKLYSILHISALIISISIALFTVTRFGAEGVAFGSLLAWFIVLSVTIPYSAHVANVGLIDLFRHSFIKPIITTLIACAFLLLFRILDYPNNIFEIIAEGAAGAVIYSILVWVFCLSKQERIKYLNMLKRFYPVIG